MTVRVEKLEQLWSFGALLLIIETSRELENSSTEQYASVHEIPLIVMP